MRQRQSKAYIIKKARMYVKKKTRLYKRKNEINNSREIHNNALSCENALADQDTHHEQYF